MTYFLDLVFPVHPNAKFLSYYKIYYNLSNTSLLPIVIQAMSKVLNLLQTYLLLLPRLKQNLFNIPLLHKNSQLTTAMSYKLQGSLNLFPAPIGQQLLFLLSRGRQAKILECAKTTNHSTCSMPYLCICYLMLAVRQIAQLTSVFSYNWISRQAFIILLLVPILSHYLLLLCKMALIRGRAYPLG